VQAWAVDGDTVAVYDARRGRRDEERFTVESPCRVVRSRSFGRDAHRDGAPTDEIRTADTFVFASDGLHVAMAPAAGGFERGALVTACVDSRVYRFDEQSRRCQSSLGTIDGLGPPPSMECAIDPGAVEPSLVLRPMEGGESVRLPFYGDALLSPELLAHVAEARPSFREAMRRADALVDVEGGARGEMPPARQTDE
jgi:hypothetical protein